MLSSFRSLAAFALSLFAVLALATAASAQTPIGGLQQLPPPDDCLSTQPEAVPEDCTAIAGGTTDARAIAIPPDGLNAYVVASTGGDNPDNAGSLATFTRNIVTGELSFNSCIADVNSAETCGSFLSQLEGASHVVATNEHVYVAAAESGAVRGFSRDAETGLLTPLPLPGGCVEATGAQGCTNGDDGLEGVDHLVLSTDGEWLFALSPESGRIVILDRNPATGALANGTGVDQDDVESAAFSPDGAFLYAVSGGTTNTLRSYSFTAPGGSPTLTLDQCFRGTLSAPDACPATGMPPLPPAPTPGLNNLTDVIALPMDGGGWNVYTVGSGSQGTPGSALARFTDSAGDGNLAFNECRRDNDSTEACSATAQGMLGATSITANPVGSFLYVTGNGDDAIQYLPRNTTNGTVSVYSGADQQCVSEGNADCGADNDKNGLLGVNDARVSPDGRFLYSTAFDSDAVAEFQIQHKPSCDDITRGDVPFETAVVLPTTCTDLNFPRETLDIVNVTQPGPEPNEGTAQAVDTDNDGHTDSIRYTPPTGYTGETTFTFQAQDSQGNLSDPATVTLTVLPPGPVISISDAAQSESDPSMVFTLHRSGQTVTSHVVSFTTQNDTATGGEDFTGTSGTVTFDPGETQETITVPLIGDNVDETTERFRVNLTGVNNNASISDSLGIGTIADDDTAVVSIGDDTVAEDGGPASVTVTLSNPSSRTVTVTYSTTEGSATDPEDYDGPAANTTVSFAPGDTSETISIPIVDDTAVEQTEQFTVTIAGPTGGAQLGDTSGTVSITDDERPTVAIADTGIAEGDSGTRNASFAVTLSAPTSSTVTVNYGTLNGSATAGSDYTASSGTVVFGPGETTKTVTVPVIGDGTEEPDETFSVLLSTPTNAVIADGTGVGTIQNDDRAPAPPPQEPPAPRPGLVVGDTGIAEGDAGTRNAVFTVALSQAASAPVTVDVTTANGTALGGEDYLGGSGRLTFAPGETAKAVPVQVRGDAVPEPDETFTVRLSGATGADIVKAVGIGTIANDDIRRRLPGLRFAVSPRRDVTLPHVFTVTGRVVLPSGVSEAEGCGNGFVNAQYKNRGNTISSRRVVLDDECEFRIRTPFNIRSRLRNTRSLKLTVRFLGNRYLSPRRAQAVFVRIR